MSQLREFQLAIAEIMKSFGSDVVITKHTGVGYDASVGQETHTDTASTTVSGFFHKAKFGSLFEFLKKIQPYAADPQEGNQKLMIDAKELDFTPARGMTVTWNGRDYLLEEAQAFTFQTTTIAYDLTIT